MPDRTDGKISLKQKNLIVALNMIDSLLKNSDQKKIAPDQMVIILDALARSDEPSLVIRFPAVLALCARQGIELNSVALFSRCGKSNPKRRNMEKLILISTWLLQQENLKVPENLVKMTEPIMAKNRAVLSSDTFRLSSGVRISIQNMHKTLKKYTSDLSQEKPLKDGTRGRRSRQFSVYLDRLFSPKQKQLIFKKLEKQSLTKTEREYYSRVIRKKLEAIANGEVREIAEALSGK